MRKILIIEDEKELNEGIAEILRFEGYTPLQSHNGYDGLKIAERDSPDLILCDIVMPDLDGYEVLERIKKQILQRPVPFIFITALTDRPNYRKGMEQGADDYLTKPFTRKELLNAVSSRIDKYKDLEKYVGKKIYEIEKDTEDRISRLTKEVSEKSEYIVRINAQKNELDNYLREKETELMEETMKVIETNNTIYNLKKLIAAKLKNKYLNSEQTKLLTELKNRVCKKNILCNGWIIFQMKFSQAHPGFIASLTSRFAGLTQYELVFISATYAGLSTSQMANLFNISEDSVRKSRYRIKKKLGLKKSDDFLKFVHSFNFSHN